MFKCRGKNPGPHSLTLTSLQLLPFRLLQQLLQIPLLLLRGEAQRRHLLLVTSLGALTALPE